MADTRAIEAAMKAANESVPGAGEGAGIPTTKASVSIALSAFRNNALAYTKLTQNEGGNPETMAAANNATIATCLEVPPKSEDENVPVEASVAGTFVFGFKANQ